MEEEGAFFNTCDFKLRPKKLGKGAYGKVYVAENVKDHLEYAAKLVNIENGFDGPDQKLFLRESLILNRLDHIAIVKLIGINFRSFSDPKLLQPTIITEYLRNGSLKDNLNKERNALSKHEWTSTKKYIHLLGISDALRYLHEQGIAHRDLKPENILVDEDFYPRVCDFGLSKCFPNSLTKSMKLTMTGQFGTPLYLPPEILRGGDSYDQSVDVYAFGMIAYEIVTGNEPFSELGQNISPFALIENIRNGYRPKFPEFVTEKMQELISRCWSESVEERPTFKEIFEALSSDLTYSSESLDEDEIQIYLDMLHESSVERSQKNSSHKKEDEEKKQLLKELTELKEKLSELQNEHDTLHKSNCSLYYGLRCLLGNKDERQVKQALNHLRVSASKGNRYSSFIVGLLNETGEEIEQNIEESFKYYELSAKQGNSSGYFRIGRCHSRAYGVDQDYAKAREYYEKAAELGDANAINNLGVFYEKGKGVDQDYAKAKEYYEKAAELGNAAALNNLGHLYEKGKGVEQDYTKAKEYYEKAAELGNVEALNNLGLLYKKAHGVDQDYTKAKEYFEKAAELGYACALNNLGVLYKKGHGVDQDYTKAKEYYEIAAELGDAKALKNLKKLNNQQ